MGASEGGDSGPPSGLSESHHVKSLNFQKNRAKCNAIMKNKKTKPETGLTVVKPKALPLPAVVPKPTKADIINAAVARARQKYNERAEALRQKQEEMDAKIVAECLCLMKEGGMEKYDPSLGYTYKDYVRVEFQVSGPLITKLLKEKEKIEHPGWFSEDQERAKIRHALDGSQDRVNLILSREENVALLDDLLKKINAKKED